MNCGMATFVRESQRDDLSIASRDRRPRWLLYELGETAKQLRDFARDWDIPFEEVVLRLLRGRQYVTTNSKPIRAVSSVASTEA
jgi:hypothetical protein